MKFYCQNIIMSVMIITNFLLTLMRPSRRIIEEEEEDEHSISLNSNTLIEEYSNLNYSDEVGSSSGDHDR
jgi:hypothetical protein